MYFFAILSIIDLNFSESNLQRNFFQNILKRNWTGLLYFHIHFLCTCDLDFALCIPASFCGDYYSDSCLIGIFIHPPINFCINFLRFSFMIFYFFMFGCLFFFSLYCSCVFLLIFYIFFICLLIIIYNYNSSSGSAFVHVRANVVKVSNCLQGNNYSY